MICQLSMERSLPILPAYELIPGRVDKKQLMYLIDISSIRSRKVINALEDYFVSGQSRKRICNKHKVNQGYLSIKIREIQEVSSKIEIISHYV